MTQRFSAYSVVADVDEEWNHLDAIDAVSEALTRLGATRVGVEYRGDVSGTEDEEGAA